MAWAGEILAAIFLKHRKSHKVTGHNEQTFYQEPNRQLFNSLSFLFLLILFSFSLVGSWYFPGRIVDSSVFSKNPPAMMCCFVFCTENLTHDLMLAPETDVLLLTQSMF